MKYLIIFVVKTFLQQNNILIKFSAHFHKKAKKWYIKHYYGSTFIGKKINKNGEFVRRYKQNYKFEYLDLDWNENPLIS